MLSPKLIPTFVVAFGSLTLVQSAAVASDSCTISGATTTCAGNQSGGVVGNTANLVVTQMSADISPPSGQRGVSLYLESGDASVDADLRSASTFSIITVGAAADGIFSMSEAGSSAVVFAGNITTSGLGSRGITSLATTAASIQSTGNISSNGDSLFALGASATVTAHGTIVSANGEGIHAEGSSGVASVTFVGTLSSSGVGINVLGSTSSTVVSSGDITSGADAIASQSSAGASSVTSYGKLMVTGAGRGIFSSGQSSSVTSQGNVTVLGDSSAAIFGMATGAGLASNIVSTGKIVTTGLSTRGIQNESQGDASTISTGDISTQKNAATAIFTDAAGASGSAAIISTGSISTAGDFANGLHAQSSSGASSVTSSGKITTLGQSSAGIFNQAQGASPNGDATVVSTGDLISSGSNSRGIYNHSDNGLASTTSTGAITSAGEAIFTYGSAASVVSTGRIISTANEGIHSQSTSGAASIVSSGQITSYKAGLFAQGEGSSSVTSVGAITTTGSDSFADAIHSESASGASTVSSVGNLSTFGDYGRGVYSAGLSSSSIDSHGNISTTGASSAGLFGSATGLGGGSTITSTGNISTVASNAVGIFNESLYGSATTTSVGAIAAGGDAIFATAGLDYISSITSTGSLRSVSGRGVVNISAGSASTLSNGAISSSGDGIFTQTTGGAATIVSTGDITSSAGRGIFAQSLLGNTSITSHGNIAANSDGIFAQAGTGYSATVVSTGDIVATDSLRFGVYAEGESGATITTSGDVTASGTGSVGILGVSQSGNININVLAGTVTGGSGDSGVRFDGAGTNVLNNYGAIRSISGMEGTAIQGNGGADTINNYGVVTGAVYLSTGVNAFNNQVGGVLNSGSVVDLGSGNALTNAGVISPGGSGSILSTTLTGNLVQSGSGALLIDTGSGLNDKITVLGSANVAGSVTFTTLQNVVGSWTLVSADSAPTTTATISNFLLDGVISVSGNDIVATVNGLNFAKGQTGNNAALGDYLNQAYGGLSPSLFSGLASITTSGSLSAAYDQLATGQLAISGAALIQSGQSFTSRLMSCPSNEGAYVVIREGQCVWAVAEGQRTRQKAAVSEPGSTATVMRVTTGVQFELTPDVHAGIAVGFNSSDSSTTAGQTSKGDEYSAGATLKYNRGPLLVAAALTGSVASNKNSRRVVFGDLSEVAFSTPNMSRFGGRLRAAYLFEFGSVYLKPIADMDLQNVRMRATSETGSEAFGLNTIAANHWVASVSPALELGAQVRRDGSSMSYRPYVRVGASAFSQQHFGVDAYFQTAGPELGGFTTVASIDPVSLDLAAGLDVLSTGGFALRLGYEGHYGRTLRTDIGSAKASLKF